MKNTKENKARYFGNYLGATICYPEIDNKITKAKLTSVGFEEIQTTYFRKRKSANNTHCVGDILAWKSNGNHKCNALNAYLELTPLSAITDEHSIEVAKIIASEIFMLTKSGHYVDRESNKDWISIKHKRNLISVDIDNDGYIYKYHEDIGYMRNPNMVSAIDYLRFKGYALPYLGISVEEQIEFGWIKLK